MDLADPLTDAPAESRFDIQIDDKVFDCESPERIASPQKSGYDETFGSLNSVEKGPEAVGPQKPPEKEKFHKLLKRAS